MAGLQQNRSVPSFESQPSNITLPQGFPVSELIKRLKKEKKSAKEFQSRRRDDWDDNYDLYRNKVFTNRLTQRQAVNIPLLKETIKTIMAKIDDEPKVEWKELSGDMAKEIVMQEIWNSDYERLNLEAVDSQDKKTVLLYGRAFKKLNWIDGAFDVKALDIYDVTVDPLTDPINLETARFVIHQNIFRSLQEVLNDDRYNRKSREMLNQWVNSKEGMVQGEKNREEWERKMQRIKDMGYDQSDFPLYAGGDVIVNLTEHFTNVWNESAKKFERHVVVYANDTVEMMDELLMDLLGVDFWPFVTWGDDIETQDFWSDGVADLVRTPNKILNIWFSQLVENRSLQNMNMHWYAPQQGYTPQTYEPSQGAMLAAPPLAPGQSINDVITPVAVGELDKSMDSINFLTSIIERATATEAIQKGSTAQKGTPRKAQVDAAMAAASERTLAIMKFYRRAWEDFCQKWYKIVDANASKKQTLYKTSKSGKIYPKTVYPGDWRSKNGYRARVRSTSEQEADNQKGIQKFMFVLQQFPGNAALTSIVQKRMLEMVDLTSEEIKEIGDAQKQVEQQQKQQQQQQPPQQQQPQPPQSSPTGRPQPPNRAPQLMAGLQNKIGQLRQWAMS